MAYHQHCQWGFCKLPFRKSRTVWSELPKTPSNCNSFWYILGWLCCYSYVMIQSPNLKISLITTSHLICFPNKHFSFFQGNIYNFLWQIDHRVNHPHWYTFVSLMGHLSLYQDTAENWNCCGNQDISHLNLWRISLPLSFISYSLISSNALFPTLVLLLFLWLK